jgi:hypothetical protein
MAIAAAALKQVLPNRNTTSLLAGNMPLLAGDSFCLRLSRVTVLKLFTTIRG